MGNIKNVGWKFIKKYQWMESNFMEMFEQEPTENDKRSNNVHIDVVYRRK